MNDPLEAFKEKNEIVDSNFFQFQYFHHLIVPTVLKEKTRYTSNDSNSDRDDEETSSIPNRGRSRTHLETSESRNCTRLFP